MDFSKGIGLFISLFVLFLILGADFTLSLIIASLCTGLTALSSARRRVDNLNTMAKQHKWSSPSDDTLNGIHRQVVFKSRFEDSRMTFQTDVVKELPEEITFYHNTELDQNFKNEIKDRKTGDIAFDSNFSISAPPGAMAPLFCTSKIRDVIKELYRSFRVIQLKITSTSKGLCIQCGFEKTPADDIYPLVTTLVDLTILIRELPATLLDPKGLIEGIKTGDVSIKQVYAHILFSNFYSTMDLRVHYSLFKECGDSYVTGLADLFFLENEDLKGVILKMDLQSLKDFISISTQLKDKTFLPKLQIICQGIRDKYIRSLAGEAVTRIGKKDVVDFVFQELKRIHDKQDNKRQAASTALEHTFIIYLSVWGGKDVYSYLLEYSSKDLPDKTKSVCNTVLKRMSTRLGLDDSSGNLSIAGIENLPGELSVADEKPSDPD